MRSDYFAASSTLPLQSHPAEQPVPAQAASYGEIPLHNHVSGLLQSLMPLTIRRRNLVLNEIPGDLRVVADESTLAYILWTLLDCAIQSTHDECIRIDAIKMDDRMLIQIRGAGTYFYHTIAREYRQVQHAAERLGGCISIENGKDYGMNAAFCIANCLLAA
jgi:hypothetical protein